MKRSDIANINKLFKESTNIEDQYMEEDAITQDAINRCANYTTGDLDISGCGLGEFPEQMPHIVYGDFSCRDNGLTTLDGCPRIVKGDFNCGHNKLRNLEGGPERVDESYMCNSNSLETLKGSPKEVGRNFICYSNKLTTLEGAPEYIDGIFACGHNPLVSLEGCPQENIEAILCSWTLIKNLEGSPRSISGDMNLSGNHLLKSLEGAPDHIGGTFNRANYNHELTDADYREYIKNKKYKANAIAGTEDEAGLGDMLDIL